MEGGTLDFEDLMDTGDEYPGFEISKFTPANETGNDDSILRTPEHKPEDEYSPSKEDPTKTDDDKVTDETDECDDQPPILKAAVDLPEEPLEPTIHGNQATDDGLIDRTEPEDSIATDEPSVEPAEDLPDDDKEAMDTDSKPEEADRAMPAFLNLQRKSDMKPAEVGDPVVNGEMPDITERPLETKGESQDDAIPIEETPKKKKLYLQPPKPRAKLKLWTDKKDAEGDNNNSQQNGDHGDEDSEGKGSSSEQGADKSAAEEEEEDPHQQSFLSFLNLKPGMSKPKDDTDKEKEARQQKEFYSRKRLRTRKAVSYVYEDEANSDDDDFKVSDEEEDDKDHFIDLTSPKRSRPRPNSHSPTKTTAPHMNYAKAIQNLLPGVDLQCLDPQKKWTTQSASSLLPKMNVDKVPVPRAKVQAAPVMPQSLLPKSLGQDASQYIKGLFECGLCGIFFSTASQFITHQESAHVEDKKAGRSAMETFRCEICNFVLTNRYAYLEHKKMKHNKAVNFTCNKCKVSFGMLSELQKHQQSCGLPSCTTCNKTFKSWVEVGEHRIKFHNAAGPMTRQWLNCVNKTCQFKCLTQHEMKIHIKNKHMISELFSCNAPRCARIFSTREFLNEHKKEAHASEFIVQYQCIECKNCFSSKTLLAEHQYLHTMEKLRKCDLCSRSFSTFADLRRHREVHVVKGTLRCQACNRWCLDKSELTNHTCSLIRKNPGLRIYFCDVCQKDFRSDEKMFAHRKEHKNFYQCGTCFLECKSEEDYIDHRKVHGKYLCLECFEEVQMDTIDSHKEAHRYYVKVEDMETEGKKHKVMFLCPNLINAVRN